jgi:hypothetical protein
MKLEKVVKSDNLMMMGLQCKNDIRLSTTTPRVRYTFLYKINHLDQLILNLLILNLLILNLLILNLLILNLNLDLTIEILILIF